MGASRFDVTAGGQTHPVEVEEGPDRRFRVRIDGEWVEVDARLTPGGAYSILVGSASYLVDVSEVGGELVIVVGGESHRLRLEDTHRPGAGRTAALHAGSQRLVAPMPGKVVAVHVAPGQRVEPGAPLIALEAMKMENEFRATAAGTVAEVRVAVGQAVNAGDVLVVIGADTPSPGA